MPNSFYLPLSPAAPDLCVRDADDVIAAHPREYRTDDHPVLDALAEAHAAMHLAYQEASDTAAAQSDLLRATGAYLDGLVQDRAARRAEGESDEDCRNRIMAWQDTVTPTAILATVNAILAPYTTGQAQLCESILDRWFVEDDVSGPAVWGSFITDGTEFIGPSYPDRLYEDDAALNGGLFRPQSDPCEPLIFTDDDGRQFLLRIPELNDVNGPTAYAYDDTETTDVGTFVEDGTATVEMTFVSPDYLLADETYRAVVAAVNQIKGHGIRWILVVDSRLQ